MAEIDLDAIEAQIELRALAASLMRERDALVARVRELENDNRNSNYDDVRNEIESDFGHALKRAGILGEGDWTELSSYQMGELVFNRVRELESECDTLNYRLNIEADNNKTRIASNSDLCDRIKALSGEHAHLQPDALKWRAVVKAVKSDGGRSVAELCTVLQALTRALGPMEDGE
jgi:hypothetical protein